MTMTRDGMTRLYASVPSVSIGRTIERNAYLD
jgi:hypothetical protein